MSAYTQQLTMIERGDIARAEVRRAVEFVMQRTGAVDPKDVVAGLLGWMSVGVDNNEEWRAWERSVLGRMGISHAEVTGEAGSTVGN